MFSDNSIFFLILDNINHFANSAAHIHEVHFYFRCPNALSEKLTVVEVDMTSAKLNTDVLASYPAGFYRKNCVIIGISVYDRVNNNYYSLFGDTTVTAMLGSKVIVKTSQSNYIGAGSKIRVVLYKIA